MPNTMSPSPQSRNRQQTKQETRQALINAARGAFFENGLTGPSLDAICAKAGFTRGAFYVHFESRDDLVAAVMGDVLLEIVNASLSAGAGGGLEGSIGRYIEAVRGLAGAPRFHQLLEACGRSPQVAEQFKTILGEAGRRLEKSIEDAQTSAQATTQVAPAGLASLLILGALGVVVAEQVELPYDLDGARRAVLDLLEL